MIEMMSHFQRFPKKGEKTSTPLPAEKSVGGTLLVFLKLTT